MRKRDCKVFGKAGELEKHKENYSTRCVHALLYNWEIKNYILGEQCELTEGESKKLDGQDIDEKRID